MSTVEQKRARVEYMRRYREKNRERLKPVRQTEAQRYWRENKEKISAKRKAKPRTDKDRERGRIYAKKWREKYPEKFKAAQKRHNSKNPQRSWRIIQKNQEKKAGRPRSANCEICGTPDSGPGRKGNGRVAFDHCHKTGAFRGWICACCNKAIGFAKNDPAILRAMIVYLEEFNKNLPNFHGSLLG